MDQTNKLHLARLKQWSVRFSDQKNSGLTVRQWCEQNQLSIHAYNYWKHLLKQQVIDQIIPDIVPLTVISSPQDTGHVDYAIPANCTINDTHSSAKLTIADVSIEIDDTSSADFISTLINAVRHA